MAPGALDLCSLYAHVTYDFDGDNVTDRSEYYNKYYLAQLPQFEVYSQVRASLPSPLLPSHGRGERRYGRGLRSSQPAPWATM